MDPEKPSHINVNYLYFGAFLVLLGTMSASSVFMKDYFLGSRIFFLLYSFGQATLEVGGFIFLGWLIRKYLGALPFWLFIGGTFFLCLFHIFDFVLDRILDLSVWGTLYFVIDESFDDFLYLLDASGVPLWAWIGFATFLLALPLIGMAIYKGTQLIAEKRPLFLRQELFLQMFVCLPVALFLWDCSASRIIHPDAYTAFVKSLPWKFTFIQPNNVLIPLLGTFQSPKSEPEVQAILDATSKQPLNKRPNIYLFVIESLRADCITPKGAPHLSRFRDENIHFDSAFSNANGSHPSWFSIFHSQFSIFWKKYRNENWALGSPSLNLLKKWGYQVRVYSSAQLGYYGMDQLIFGKDLHLVDAYQTFHHVLPKQPWETDLQAIQTLQKDLADHPELQEGQVFIVFWDATHFDYSWPKDHPAPFVPFAKDFAYFRAYQSKKNIELIKNRYRNAVHYTDSLFGSFWEQLPNKEQAIVVVLGDHGEEFFEHGHLFHNSHLTDEQTHIPLYFKFGSNQTLPARSLASQMDIFPSIIDYLSGKVPSFLEGESIFRPSKWPYAFIARFNGGRTPYEFCIHNGRNKLIAQFVNQRSVFTSRSLKIRSLSTCKDTTAECRQSVEAWIGEEFNGAFERLFPTEE